MYSRGLWGSFGSVFVLIFGLVVGFSGLRRCWFSKIIFCSLFSWWIFRLLSLSFLVPFDSGLVWSTWLPLFASLLTGCLLSCCTTSTFRRSSRFLAIVLGISSAIVASGVILAAPSTTASTNVPAIAYRIQVTGVLFWDFKSTNMLFCMICIVSGIWALRTQNSVNSRARFFARCSAFVGAVAVVGAFDYLFVQCGFAMMIITLLDLGIVSHKGQYREYIYEEPNSGFLCIIAVAAMFVAGLTFQKYKLYVKSNPLPNERNEENDNNNNRRNPPTPQHNPDFNRARNHFALDNNNNNSNDISNNSNNNNNGVVDEVGLLLGDDDDEIEIVAPQPPDSVAQLDQQLEHDLLLIQNQIDAENRDNNNNNNNNNNSNNSFSVDEDDEEVQLLSGQNPHYNSNDQYF